MEDGLNDEEEMEGMVPVILPSGALFHVHQQEFDYFEQRSTKYQSDNKFQNVSDLQDVDRLLILELLCMRWGLWVSMQRNYWGEGVDENALQKSLKDHSAEIRQLKKSLGVDRESSRETRGENSVDNYLQKLRQRALQFGYMRNAQASAAIELFMDLSALITLHDNCDEKERVEQQCGTEDVLRWIRDTAIPRFEAIDEEFRMNPDGQQTWIRDQ